MADVFFDIGIIMMVSAVLATVARLLKQPLIPAYVIAGLLIGPVYHLITDQSSISLYSEIGIAFLLFIVGLGIDIKKLRDVGIVSSIGGTIQILSLFTAGLIVASLIGFSRIEAIYTGVILAFSSTMIVVKLLSDKKELDSLHGRIILGLLLIEDFFAIVAISIFDNIDKFSILLLIIIILKGIGMLIIALICSRYIFPPIFKFAAKSIELLFLLGLAVLFAFSLLFNLIGFSIVIGAFIAGVTLASLPYHVEIISKMKPLRDFFIILFFVSLGTQISIASISDILIPLLILLAIIIVLKPLITSFICAFFGYKRKTAYLTGSYLPQISEFALIIAAQGVALGIITERILTLTVLLTLTTMVYTTYIAKYSSKFYMIFSDKLKYLDRLNPKNICPEPVSKHKKFDVIVCGHNRIGYSIVKKARKMKKKILVLDFNPEIVKDMEKKHIPCIYGDIGDQEILDSINLKDAKMVVSTIPTINDNLLLIHKTRRVNNKAIIFVTAMDSDEALELYDNGADYVIIPHFLGGEHASLMLETFSTDVNKIINTKLNHIKELKERSRLGHDHQQFI